MLGDVLKWSPSPHIYSGEPPSPRPWNQQGTPGTDVVSQSESATSKPEGGGAHGLVGRPPTRPTDLLLVAVGCSQGPLVNGLWLGFFPAGFLLWWPFGPCVATSDRSVFDPRYKGCDCPPFSAKSCTHRNLDGHVEFGDLLVA